MLEGIIILVVIGTVGYFMWQKSKKTETQTEEPEAPYKVEAVVAPAAQEAPSLSVTTNSEVKEVKPKAKKAKATKPKTEKPKGEGKSKAVAKKPKIAVAK